MACETRTASRRRPSGRTGRPSLSWRLATIANRSALPVPLAVAVGRALHVRSRPPRRRRACWRPRRRCRSGSGCPSRATGAPQRTASTTSATSVGQHAAVGVAQDGDLGAGLGGGAQHLHGVVRVAAVAVEEVLGVEEDPPALGAQVARRCRGPSRGSPRASCAARARRAARRHFATRRHDGRSASRAGRAPGVVGGLHAGPAGGAERDELRVLQVELGPAPGAKNSVSFGIAPGPAALDEADAELVERRAIGELVPDRERDALPLRAVAQRRVVDMERSRSG